MEKNKIEKLREELYRAIEFYGRDSPIALKISGELDLYIVKEMIEENYTKGLNTMSKKNL